MDPVSTTCSGLKVLSACLNGQADNQSAGGAPIPPAHAEAHSSVEVGDVTCCSPISFKRGKSRRKSVNIEPEKLKRAAKIFAQSVSDLETSQTVHTRKPKIEVKIDDTESFAIEDLSDSKKLSLIGRLSASFRRRSQSSPSESPSGSRTSSKRNSIAPEVNIKRNSVMILEKLEADLLKELKAMELEDELTETSISENESD